MRDGRWYIATKIQKKSRRFFNASKDKIVSNFSCCCQKHTAPHLFHQNYFSRLGKQSFWKLKNNGWEFLHFFWKTAGRLINCGANTTCLSEKKSQCPLPRLSKQTSGNIWFQKMFIFVWRSFFVRPLLCLNKCLWKTVYQLRPLHPFTPGGSNWFCNVDTFVWHFFYIYYFALFID